MYEIHWLSTTDTLASYEDLSNKLDADEGYQKLLGQARQGQLFVGSSITDRLFKTVA